MSSAPCNLSPEPTSITATNQAKTVATHIAATATSFATTTVNLTGQTINMSNASIVLREQIMVAPIQPYSQHASLTVMDLDIVVFGKGSGYTAAVLVHASPALEGAAERTPEAALRQLLLASAEVLEQYIPKLAGHQRTLHEAGGIFDEDMIAPSLTEAKLKLNSSV
nr:hypothetical protein CFP56_28516 [Quercus suber]